jgi:hypothetical protein
MLNLFFYIYYRIYQICATQYSNTSIMQLFIVILLLNYANTGVYYEYAIARGYDY